MATAISSTTTRVLNNELAKKIMSGDEAAALIRSGDQVGMSGFTGSGYPKVVPIELARRISEANFRGQKFQVSVFTGASTGPELDGALAMAGGINLRLPYQSDPETRKRINAGEMEYMDVHLSHVAQIMEYGFLGKLNVALIEVAAVLEDGRLLPSSSIGNNRTWIDCAERVILEVNCVAAASAGGHARHLLRSAAAAESRAYSIGPSRAAHWITVSESRSGEGGGRGAHRFA